MRGCSIPLSAARRAVADFVWAGANVPAVSLKRPMDLSSVVAARRRCAQRPSWRAIFSKAFALVAQEEPQLRRAYVNLPWPQLYEYPASVAYVTIERVHEGEPVIFGVRVMNPARLTLPEVDWVIQEARNEPLQKVRDFQRVLQLGHLPWMVRRPLWWIGLNAGRLRANFFGTFVVTGVSELGAETNRALAPQSMMLTYGVISDHAASHILLTWDHRVVDGVAVARALTRLEETLRGRIVEEMMAMPGVEPA